MSEIVNSNNVTTSNIFAPKSQPENVDTASREKKDNNNDMRDSRSSRVTSTISQQIRDDNDSNSDTEASDENTLLPSSQTEIEGGKIAVEEERDGSHEIRVTGKADRKSQESGKSLPNENVQRQGSNVPKKLSPACPNCRKHKVGCKHRYLINVDNGMTSSKNRPKKRKRAIGGDAQISYANSKASAATGIRVAKSGAPTKKPRQIRLDYSKEDDATDEYIPSREFGAVKMASSKQQQAVKDGQFHNKRKLNGGSRAEDDEDEQGVDSDVYTIAIDSPPQNQSKRGRKSKVEHVGITNTIPGVTTTATTKTSDTSSRKAGKAPVLDCAFAEPSTGLGFPVDNLQGAIHMSRHTTLSRELQQRLEDCEMKWGAAIDSLNSAKSLLDGWVESWQGGL